MAILFVFLPVPIQCVVCCARNFFGHLVEIRGDKYAEIIDKESPDVFVIISIYEEVVACHPFTV